jgi:ribosomal protein S13
MPDRRALRPGQRAAAQKAAKGRAAANRARDRDTRVALRKSLSAGTVSLQQVFARAETGLGRNAIGKLRILAVLEALPGLGTLKAHQILESLGIPETRRVHSLSWTQRKDLVDAVRRQRAVISASGSRSAGRRTRQASRVATQISVLNYTTAGHRSRVYRRNRREYLKVERYDDCVAVHWTTDGGPAALYGQIDLKHEAGVALLLGDGFADKVVDVSAVLQLLDAHGEPRFLRIELDNLTLLWRVAEGGLRQAGSITDTLDVRLINRLVAATATSGIRASARAILKDASALATDRPR